MNTVSPGPVETSLWLNDQEVADLVLLLASDRAGTGTGFIIDGGLVKTL